MLESCQTGVIVLEDGTAKVGKGTVGSAIEASYRAIEPNRNCQSISAGNAYRAMTALVIADVSKSTFSREDAEGILERLGDPDYVEMLQNDENIPGKLAQVAQMEGAQQLGDIVTSQQVLASYMEGGITVFDARNPFNTLNRNNLIGDNADQVRARSLVPLLVTCPVADAARRMRSIGQDFYPHMYSINARNQEDRGRVVNAYSNPPVSELDWANWAIRVRHGNLDLIDGVPEHFQFNNGGSSSIANLQTFGGEVADLVVEMQRAA